MTTDLENRGMKYTYVLFGNDAVTTYECDGIDAVVEGYENNEFGVVFKALHDDMTVAEILYQGKDWNDYAILTEEEYNKLAEV